MPVTFGPLKQHTPKNPNRITQKDIDSIFPDYRENLTLAMVREVRLAHDFSQDGTPKGGVTIAYQKANPESKNGLYKVTAVYCNKEDVFVKKYGAALALERFFNEQWTYMDVGRDNVEYAGTYLKNLFTPNFELIAFE
jgi:hypothetical protein